ncbi:unnamed protein product [Calypogeia fissa]
MAVDHNMAELNTTWWDLLRKIVFNLDWSYAALWTLTCDGRNLVWKQGYFHVRSNADDDANSLLFHSLYSTCTFTPGEGFAGHALAYMTNSILWLSGDDLDSLTRPVPNQTRFLQSAGIQTVVCLPLGLSSSYVLELGTVNRVRETDDLAHDIKRILLHLLTDGLQRLINENTAAGIPQPGPLHQQSAAPDRLREQIRSSYDTLNPRHHSPLARPLAMADEAPQDPARKYTRSTNFYPPNIEGGAPTPKAPQQQQRSLGPNIFSELLQSVEHDDLFPRHGILRGVPPQLSVEVPELHRELHHHHGSAEHSPGGDRLTSPWATESALSQMEMNAFQTWTSMAEVTSTLDVALRGLPGSSSATSSRMAEEIVDPNDEIGQILPFATTLEQMMAAAAAASTSTDQPPQQHGLLTLGALPGGGGGGSLRGSLRGSSSRSSMSMRSQNVEDTEISSAILESYADCHISELENVPRGVSVGGGGGGGGSSSTTMPGESEGNWRGGGTSSKETSPDSLYGIHARISSTTSSARQKQHHQQQIMVDMQQQLGGSTGGPSSSQQQQQRSSQRFERQHSNLPEQNINPQDADFKPAGTAGGGASGPSSTTMGMDSTPRLVQFGNVLQLGNAAGQVTEPLPQEHDEAAFSHMLAERRRRTKQNENFSQLKFLIPSAAKLDKASVLAATITYIHELKARVKDLELSNQSLKNQLLGGEPDQSSAGEPLLSTMAKGSPGRVRVRTPSSHSPTDEDKIQVSPNGDGNVTIEIRSPCTQPDIAMHIFACLKEMQLRVINFNVAVNDNRIHASIIVKVKRKNAAGQSAVCAEVEQAITACLYPSG